MPILAELRARPFVLFAMAMGLALTYRSHPWQVLLAIPVLFLFGVWWQRGVCLFLVCLGILFSPTPVQPIFESEPVKGEFSVRTAPRIGRDTAWVVIEGGGRRYALYTPAEPEKMVSLGDRIALDGRAVPLREGTDEFWAGKGVIGAIRDSDFQVVARGPNVFRWGIAWRDSFMRLSGESLRREEAELIDALCFNVDSGLQPDFREDLRRTGVIHIVSASGLHVMVFAFSLQWAFRRLPFPRTFQLILLLVILLLYAGATGFRPPVVRAVVMATLMLGAYLVKREGDLLSAAGVAALGQLALDPWSVYDIGFYLSFITISALGLYMPLGPAHGAVEKVKRSLQASLIATAASAPIVGCFFGSISLIGILANLLIGVFILPIVSLSLLAWGLSFVWPWLAGQILSGTAAIGGGYIRFFVENLSAVPFAAVDLPSFSPYVIPIVYVAFLAGWRFKRRPAD